MKRFPEAGQCIYCGKKNDLSTEHIVPFSLGGDVELPKASCPTCRDLTSSIELRVARHQLHVPRTVAGYPSRRKKGYPRTVQITLRFANGKKAKRDVAVDQAPIAHIVPFLPMKAGLVETSPILLSCSKFETRFREDHQELTDAICKKYGATHVTSPSVQIHPESFYRMLWKIASGMFWQFSREAYLASDCQIRVRTGEGLFLDDLSCQQAGSGKHSHCVDLYSIEEPPIEPGENLKVSYSPDGKWVFCKIDFLRLLGFPRYICRIPS